MSDRKNTGKHSDHKAREARKSNRSRRKRERALQKWGKLAVAAVVLLVLVLILLKVGGFIGGGSGEAGESDSEAASVTAEIPESSGEMTENPAESTGESGEETTSADPARTSSVDESSSESGSEGTNAGGSGSGSGNANSGSSGANGSGTGGSDSDIAGPGASDTGDNTSDSSGSQDSKPEEVALPCTAPGQNIQLVSLASYDGIYFEDGSDEESSDVAVLTLKNTGSKPAEFVRISFKGSGVEYHFEGSAIPAGATVVIQEKDRKSCKKGKYTDMKVEVAEMDALEMHQDKVKVEDKGEGRLAVTNLTDSQIPTVRVFYKLYMADEDIYVGGITYNSKINGLDAGATVEITPSHFVSGSGKVMMVRLYDEVQ